MNDFTLQELLRTYIAETADNLDAMERGVLALERKPQDEEVLGEVFRMAHSVKGSAACVGYTLVADFAHGSEELLERIRSGKAVVSTAVVTALLMAVDALRDLVQATSAGRQSLTFDEERLLAVLLGLGNGSESAADELEQIRRNGAGRNGGDKGGQRALHRTLRVDTERIDRMIDISGEIAISRGRLRQLLEQLPREVRLPLLEACHESDRLFLDMQELVMKTRMVPVERALSAFHRTVRDLAREQGKIAHLAIVANDVEIDHGVMEKLRDPLTHMIRNAVDHGIELPEERIAAGKDPRGRIVLTAQHDGGSIIIRVEDDGAGISRDRVLAVARQKSLLDDARTLADPEILSLIFEPGFSTSENVSDVSGRGVGMDVVRRNIESLHGSVTLSSIEGKGTAIVTRLPLTLAIIEGFGVSAGREHYVIPLPLVVECMRLPREHERRDDRGGVFDLRGTPVPFVRLARLLGTDTPRPARENVVIVDVAGRLAGIAVDELHGDGQVVVKPMSELFRTVRGLSGSAILGDGRVALILDVPALLEDLVAESAA